MDIRITKIRYQFATNASDEEWTIKSHGEVLVCKHSGKDSETTELELGTEDVSVVLAQVQDCIDNLVETYDSDENVALFYKDGTVRTISSFASNGKVRVGNLIESFMISELLTM